MSLKRVILIWKGRHISRDRTPTNPKNEVAAPFKVCPTQLCSELQHSPIQLQFSSQDWWGPGSQTSNDSKVRSKNRWAVIQPLAWTGLSSYTCLQSSIFNELPWLSATLVSQQSHAVTFTIHCWFGKAQVYVKYFTFYHAPENAAYVSAKLFQSFHLTPWRVLVKSRLQCPKYIEL